MYVQLTRPASAITELRIKSIEQKDEQGQMSEQRVSCQKKADQRLKE
jgi:hypothetical protein